MRGLFFIRKLLIVLILMIFFIPVTVSAQKTYWSKEFADAIIDRYDNINNLTGKGWEYSNSIVLIGIEKVYYETGNIKYLNYIKKYIDNYIDEAGNISFNADANNLDHLHPGWLCLTLYEELGLEKYKLAAQTIRNEFDNQPRNASGGFWHKNNYPDQMWADGIYMAEPFLIRYGYLFDDLDYAADETTFQTILFADHVYDSTSNLLIHGWDESKEASWADSVTGNSSEVWSRGMGWYCMALVDILDYLPEDHKNYNRIIEILNGLAAGIKTYQDQETGLWYQVVNKGDSADNWIETSGSAMFVYSLKKAIDKGYIDSLTYMPVVLKGWEGLQAKITLDSKNQPVINDFVWGMGIKNTYEDYISQQRVSTPDSRYPHGYCGILLASSVMEFPLPDFFSLSISKEGNGTIDINPDSDEYEEGTEVTLSATPSNGWKFSTWQGSVISSENPIHISMDSNISIKAVFEEISTSTNRLPVSNLIDVYPTVAENNLTVNINSDFLINNWKIYSSTGEMIRYSICNTSRAREQIDISDLYPGLYYIAIEAKNNFYSAQFLKR